MQSSPEKDQSPPGLQPKPALTFWRVSMLVLGTVFFGLVAAIHGISASGASSIWVLVILWVFVPAPVVFLWLMLSPRIGKTWRVLFGGHLFLAAVLSVAVLGGVGWIGAERAVHPKPCTDAPGLADYPALQPVAEQVSFPVPEGGRRVGWFIPGHKSPSSPFTKEGRGEATILLLHGYGCRRQEMLDYAQVLHQAGYSTMLFDFRNRGESDGDAVTLGFYEQQDAVAAVEYLKARRDVDMERLGVLGISMGASVAILVTARAPEIKAAIADSPFESASKAVEEGFTRVTGLSAFPFSPIALWIIQLRLGISPGDVVPRDYIAAISPRPILLIHGLADTKVTPINSRTLFAAAGEPKELWLLEGSKHTDGIKDYQQEYSRRMVEFFDKHLK